MHTDRLAIPILFITVSILLFSHEAAADVLFAGKLETCIRDGSNSSTTETLECSKKLVVTLAVGNGQLLDTEQLQFNLGCVNSRTGQCPCDCNAATDPGCTCRDLTEPLKVTVTKSALLASYPLTYERSFNWKPNEVILRPKNQYKCYADDFEQSPTCGWAYHPNGTRINYSQGFCCLCTTKQIREDTLGSTDDLTRANMDCAFKPQNIIGFVAASAHCLTWDPKYYAAYRLQAPTMDFEITVKVEIPNADGPSSGELLTLGPGHTSAISSGRVVAARLVGEFASFAQLPQFGNRLLLVPEPSGAPGTFDEKISGDRATWMLVDRSLITMDGRECDKVGTSYEAFNNQIEPCNKPQFSCLSGQLRDLWEADEKRLREGRAPLYMISQYPGSDKAELGYRGGPLSFSLPVTSQSNSLVKLSLVADSVRLVAGRSPGKITDLKVCRFNRFDCGGFEAGQRGFIMLSVTNSGNLPADYAIAVGDCTTNVRRIQERSISVQPGQMVAVEPPLDLYVDDPWPLKDRSCRVTLYDSQGEIAASQVVYFYTDATKFDKPPSGGVNTTDTGSQIIECSAACPRSYNALCFITKRCWSRLFRFLLVVCAVAAGLFLIAVAFRKGWCSALFSCCCTRLSRRGDGIGGGSEGTNKPAKDLDSDEKGPAGGAYAAPPPLAPPPLAPPSERANKAAVPWWQPPVVGPLVPPLAAPQESPKDPSMGPQPSYAPSRSRHGPTMAGLPSEHPSRGFGPVMSGLRGWYSRQLGSVASGAPPLAAHRRGRLDPGMSRGASSAHPSRGPVMSGLSSLRGWYSRQQPGSGPLPSPSASVRHHQSQQHGSPFNQHGSVMSYGSGGSHGSVRSHGSAQHPYGSANPYGGSVSDQLYSGGVLQEHSNANPDYIRR